MHEQPEADGLAVHNYISQVGVFPALSVPNFAQDWAYQEAWPATLLPHLEQSPVYSNLNFNVSLTDGANNTAGVFQMASLLCPSENQQLRPSDFYGTCSYVANLGEPAVISMNSGVIVAARENGPEMTTPFPAGGYFWNNGNNAYFGVQSATDGTSNTAMISEHLLGQVDYNTRVPRNNPNFSAHRVHRDGRPPGLIPRHGQPPTGPQFCPGLPEHPGHADRHPRCE